MSDIYILSKTGKLGKRDRCLIFSRPDGKEQVLFPFKITQLILVGNISISGAALRILTHYRIPVSFIASNGYFNARLAYAVDKNIFLRKKQYQLMDDEKQSLRIAKQIVTGKIKNEISFIQRIKRKNKDAQESIKPIVVKIKQTLHDAEYAKTLESLRGFEGTAAKLYFQVLRYNIEPSWADFPYRSKHPPKSNVNAVLSFLYTILMVRIETALESQGLDTMAGTLHAMQYGKTTLAFDLTEEFRTPIVDTVCCTLFNVKILKPEDFEKKCFSTSDDDYPFEPEAKQNDQKEIYGILLTETGLKKTVTAFQEKIQKKIMYTPIKKKISYEDIILRQVKQYKRVINGELKTYKPYYFK